MKIRSIETTVLCVPTPKPIALEYPEQEARLLEDLDLVWYAKSR